MRDARHDVELTGEPWPAAVFHELPAGVLEVDLCGRAVRVNPAFLRLLAGPGPAGSPEPAEGAGSVADRWPCLAEVVTGILAGQAVDTDVRTPWADLHVCGAPRWSGQRLTGGLVVVSPGRVEARPQSGAGGETVVDLREGLPVEMPAEALMRQAVCDDPEVPASASDRAFESVRGTRSVWLRRGVGGVRRRAGSGRGDEHAATHDVLTGLPNQVLAVQCLADALESCDPGRRVGVVAVETSLDEDSAAGARLLRDVAGRLRQLAGPGDVAARLDGPRFALVLRDVRPGADAEGSLHRVRRQLDGIRIDGPFGSTSVGVGRGGAVSEVLEGLGLVLADPSSGLVVDRDPRLVLALALEAMERSRLAGRPVVGTEPPAEAEQARVAALSEYDLYDVALDDALQGITQVALTACDALTSLVTFVDSDLQWVRAGSGGRTGSFLDARGPRHLTLCDRTIRGREVLVVPDTEADPDFLASRHVPWQVGMRFYAGAPLITGEGRAIGTLCVFDRRPRGLGERQRRSLVTLAGETVALLDAHRLRRGR